MLEPIKQTRAAGVPRAADEPDDLTARAINAAPWKPLPGMVTLRCEDCRFWFAAPRRTGAPRCPDCAIRRERLARRAAWMRPKFT